MTVTAMTTTTITTTAITATTVTMPPAMRLPRRGLAAALACALLVGCGEREVILEGERLDVRAPFVAESALPAEDGAQADMAFAVPPETRNEDWTHVGGNPQHHIVNPAFAASPQLVWTAGIGQGNDRKHRITAQPVVAGGRVFSRDSRAQITATTTSGATLWSRDLTPPTEREDDASGGGVATDGSTVYATTGFGELVALDAATGAEKWRQRLEAPATASPTVMGGLVYVVSRDNRAWAIDAENGRVKWQLPGTPDASGVVGGASPAVTERVAVFPFGSGELIAALRKGGVRLWASQISGKRRGRSYANITDITADPVIAGDVIYTGNPSGRAVALSLQSGERLWTARHGAFGPMAVAGGSVFLISDQAELVRLSAETGEEIWKVELPYFRRDKARRARDIFAHFGPVLAGGALWVASDDGNLRSFDPETGAERARLSIPGGAASIPAVAGGTMYVLSGRGQLHAFR